MRGKRAKRPRALVRADERKERENERGTGHSSGAVCESRGGRPGLSVLTSLLVSVDVKIY